jgi:glycosylphosphatidylinositol phospholipase D
VWVVYNKPAPGRAKIDDSSVVNERHWTGSQSGESLGAALDGDADVNGDGIEDLLIGAPDRWCDSAEFGGSPSPCTTLRPAAYLLFGKARAAGNRLQQVNGTITSIADVTVNGAVTTGGFGQSVELLGDHNGDGYADLAIGTVREDKAYLFYGLAHPAATFTSASAYGVVDGSGSDLSLGQSVAGDHDLDGDGRVEVLIGEGGVEWEESPASDGAAYLYLGAE